LYTVYCFPFLLLTWLSYLVYVDPTSMDLFEHPSFDLVCNCPVFSLDHVPQPSVWQLPLLHVIFLNHCEFCTFGLWNSEVFFFSSYLFFVSTPSFLLLLLLMASWYSSILEFQEIQQWGRANRDPELGLDMAFVSSLRLVILWLTMPSMISNKELFTLASAISSDKFHKPNGRLFMAFRKV